MFLFNPKLNCRSVDTRPIHGLTAYETGSDHMGQVAQEFKKCGMPVNRIMREISCFVGFN